jgi:hypothetical protein
MKPKIRSSQYEYDMADWLIEKTKALLTENTLLYENLGKSEELSEELAGGLEKRFSYIFRNATKILAFASGSDWDAEDSQLIVNNGKAGLEQVLVKYGLLEETSEDKRKGEIHAFLGRLKPLTYESTQVIRDKTRQVLSEAGLGSDTTDRIIDLLGQVSKGQLKWAEFVVKATELFNFKQEAD